MNRNTIIQSLWIGGTLSPSEQLCIQSYLSNGHEFHLYTYNEIDNIPSGVVLKNANDILPRDEVFMVSTGPHKGSYAIFADYFRYKLLYSQGGWWSDMDAVCIRFYDFSDEYVFAKEKHQDGSEKICNGIIKCPPGCELMAACIEFTEALILRSTSSISWGQTGPKLLQQLVKTYNKEQFAVDAEYFIPIGWYELHKLFDYFNLSSRTVSVHLFNGRWPVDSFAKYGIYHSSTLYEQLKKKYRVKNYPTRLVQEISKDFFSNQPRCRYKSLIKLKNIFRTFL